MSDIRKKLEGKTSKLSLDRPKQDDHPANLNGDQEGSFYHIDIELIQPDPEQPRKYFDPGALEDLANSIKSKGVLQPVLIRKTGDGKIILVAGERRFRASKIAGLDKIPAILTKGDPLEISIVENLQRENLNPIEEAEALSKMIDNHGYTQEKLAFAIGKARSTVTETLGLVKLPEEIKEECRRADIYPRRTLIEIAKQDTPEAMFALFCQVKAGNLKSDEVRRIVRRHTEKIQRTSAAITLDKVHALSKQLSKLDLYTIEASQKEILFLELGNLKTAIDKIMG